MTVTHDREETTQDILRRALGLAPSRTHVWDGQELSRPCPECGQRPAVDAPAPLPGGDPVPDVVQERAALRAAARTVSLLVDVLDQRCSPRQVRVLVDPRVLRYLQALPVDGADSHGGARLLSIRPVQ